MFTGLIERLGSLARTGHGRSGAVLEIAHEPWPTPLVPGDSICVQGACLTAVSIQPGIFSCDLLDETLNRTCLGKKHIGDALNLERAVRADQRLGGHLVTGHVDGTGVVRSVVRSGGDWILRVACNTSLVREMIIKGSVACDGVSLTIAGLTEEWFEVRLIPFTWDHTTLKGLRPGDCVNIETDMIGKYVNRSLSGGDGRQGITVDTLRKSGFA